MKMAQLILPEYDNEQKSLRPVHIALRQRLIDKFGGYTAVNAAGGWKAPDGKACVESVIVYHIAMHLQSGIELREIAKQVAGEARQQCVMVVTPNGDAEYISHRS